MPKFKVGDNLVIIKHPVSETMGEFHPNDNFIGDKCVVFKVEEWEHFPVYGIEFKLHGRMLRQYVLEDVIDFSLPDGVKKPSWWKKLLRKMGF